LKHGRKSKTRTLSKSDLNGRRMTSKQRKINIVILAVAALVKDSAISSNDYKSSIIRETVLLILLIWVYIYKY